jgi:hypothetical protein
MACLFLRIEADPYHVPGVRMYWRAIPNLVAGWRTSVSFAMNFLPRDFVEHLGKVELLVPRWFDNDPARLLYTARRDPPRTDARILKYSSESALKRCPHFFATARSTENSGCRILHTNSNHPDTAG